MGSRRLSYVVSVLFIVGSLAMIGQLDRVEAGRSYRDVGHGHANSTSTTAPNATAPSLDESKVKLRVCVRGGCNHDALAFIDRCTCCLTLPDVPCWPTDEECYDACPICDPECPTYPPPPPPEQHL